MKKLSCSSILLFLSFLIATAQSNKELKSVFESSNVSLFPRPFYYEGSSVTKLLSSEEQMLQQAQSKNVNNDILIHANNAGYYCLLSGDLIQAIKYFLLASNTYTNDDSKALLIKAHLAFANDIGCRDSQALRLYSELLESATFSKLNLKLQAYINGLAGVIYLQERDSARAIKVLNISEKQLLAEKLFKSLADLSEREGEIYLAFNKYKEALVKYNQQLKYTD